MKNIFGLLILALVAISCTEQIEIELDSTYDRVVVEGHITTDTTTHWVRLTQSRDYYSDDPVPTISNAVVKLSDGSETLQLTENPDRPGYYETTPDFYGIPGTTYELDINLEEEVGGQNEFSSTCDLNPVGPIDSIQVVYNDDWEGYEVRIFAWEPPSIDFYIFQVLKNNILLTDTIDEYWISDDRFFNGNYTNGIMVGFLDIESEEEAPLPGDKITLKMSGITEDYFNFILQLQDQTFEYRNPLFSGPPANVISYIEEGTGFFAAYSTTYSSVIFEEQK